MANIRNAVLPFFQITAIAAKSKGIDSYQWFEGHVQDLLYNLLSPSVFTSSTAIRFPASAQEMGASKGRVHACSGSSSSP